MLNGVSSEKFTEWYTNSRSLRMGKISVDRERWKKGIPGSEITWAKVRQCAPACGVSWFTESGEEQPGVHLEMMWVGPTTETLFKTRSGGSEDNEEAVEDAWAVLLMCFRKTKLVKGEGHPRGKGTRHSKMRRPENGRRETCKEARNQKPSWRQLTDV